MVSAIFYDSELEEKRHMTAIRTLARDLGIPEDEIIRLYEVELYHLKEVARVKDFLSVLVIKRVKEFLKTSHRI